ncbi:MAG: hypothetical protein COB30_000675 [Ectothiorhodospiraceae bacterium]|nr:hypothetical protein [Ectothiorhodospiraceae bacterium]
MRGDERTREMVLHFQGELSFNQDCELNGCFLIFSLKGLHEFLGVENVIVYTAFRKIIYQSSINEELQGFGGKVELHRSTGKVDESLYKLIKLQ